MSVIEKDSEEATKARARNIQNSECFYCGKRLREPFIYWMGINSEIALHPSCAAEFCIRILRDVHEVECKAQVRIHFSIEEA